MTPDELMDDGGYWYQLLSRALGHRANDQAKRIADRQRKPGITG